MDYKNIQSNSSTNDFINNNYCSNRTYNEELDFYYFEFKPLSKINIISYSNCIYYNLGKNNTNKRFINDQKKITDDKLIFLKAISNTIKSGMDIVGVSVPEKM